MVKSKCLGLRRRLCVVVVALAGAGLAAPAVSAQTGPGGYGDMAEGAYYSEAVALLDEHGVFDGTVCSRGFCPDDVVDRNTMAVWLVRILDGADPRHDPADPDPVSWRLASGESLVFGEWLERVLAGAELVGVHELYREFPVWPLASGERLVFDEWLDRVREGAEPAATYGRRFVRFGDVDYSGYYAAFVDRLFELGVTDGCGGTDFCGDRGVTRAQMAVFLSRAFELDDGADPGFGDVASDAWYASDVARLAASGITSGCGDGTDFCPDRPTTRAQMATFLARAVALPRLTQPPRLHRPVIFEALEHVSRGSQYGRLGVLYAVGDDSREQIAQQVWSPQDTGCDIWCPDFDEIVWSPDNQWFMYRTAETFDEDGYPAQGAWFVADATRPAGTNHVKLTDRAVRQLEPPGGVWSPDGSRIAYIDGDGALFVAGADGASPAKVADDVSDDWVWPPDGSRIAYIDWVWSPDGSRIAYSSRVDGDKALFVAGADGASPAKVADDVYNRRFTRSFVWSPDGSRIAYIDGDGALFVAGADGASPAKVADDVDDDNRSFVWSPDGSRIAYIDGDGALFVAGADGASPAKVADDVDHDNRPFTRAFVWSPDGSRIAYSSRVDGDDALFVAGADGASPAKVADDVSDDWLWSPDGSRIAYSSRVDGDDALFVAGADGASPAKVADDVSDDWLWSPDGSRLAYVTTREAEGSDEWDGSGPPPRASLLVGVVGIDGGEPVILRTGSSVYPGSLWWASLSWHWNGIAIVVTEL